MAKSWIIKQQDEQGHFMGHFNRFQNGSPQFSTDNLNAIRFSHYCHAVTMRDGLSHWPHSRQLSVVQQEEEDAPAAPAVAAAPPGFVQFHLHENDTLFTVQVSLIEGVQLGDKDGATRLWLTSLNLPSVLVKESRAEVCAAIRRATKCTSG